MSESKFHGRFKRFYFVAILLEAPTDFEISCKNVNIKNEDEKQPIKNSFTRR